MAFDGLFTQSIVTELQQLVGGRISRIHQPNEFEIVCQIRAQRINHKLLLSVHPNYARVQLTHEEITNPKEPPMFCTHLRKHLESGMIESIQQINNDRVIHIQVSARDEIGDPITRTLIVEIMGRHSTLILLNTERQTIIDSIKHIPPFLNAHRTILPGFEYVPPPQQQKMNPYDLSEEQFVELWSQIDTGRDFIQHLEGFSPIHGNELFARIKQEGKPFSTFSHFIHAFKELPFAPAEMKIGNKEVFSSIHLITADSYTYEAKSLGDLLDHVYYEKADRERVRTQAQDLEKWLSNERTKLERKMKILEKEQQTANRLEDFQLFGELLMANHYRIEEKSTSVEVENYYTNELVTIPLDPRKNGIENANAYYKKYSKAKHAQIKLAEQIKRTIDEIAYFNLLQQQVEMASPDDIEEIREELIENGYLKKRKSHKKNKKTKMVIERYRSSTGLEIAVGKNNKQNDAVTFKLASRHHTWLHTKDIPGSHVVILSDQPDEQSLKEAAVLAAYYSQARTSSNVPVDYTLIKHVKKPNGSKLGFVNYFEQQTLFVTPDEQLVRKLKK